MTDNAIIKEDIYSLNPDDVWETVQVDSKDYAVLVANKKRTIFICPLLL